MQAAERPEMLAMLGRAFWPDPLFGFFARDRQHEYEMFPSVFGAFAADTVPLGETWVAMAGARVMGAALWVPPGKMPRSSRREAALQARMARLLVTGRNRRCGLALLTEVDKRHPSEPHWYLSVLGVDPVAQGKGLGTQLLGPVLDRADAEGVPAYLETQKEENLAFYIRHGFEETDRITVPGSPPVWTMWRHPRER